MRITPLDAAAPRPRRVAVGEFDGVHLGHRAVIEGTDTVLTFDPHPLAVIRPEAAPKLLTTLERKAELVAALGVEELVVIPFDERFAQRSAAGLRRPASSSSASARRTSRSARTSASATAPRATRRCCGADERSRRGSSRWSRSRARSSPPATSAGSCSPARSSTRRRFLGAPFQLRGEVVGGDRRGRELGFPTANLVPDQALIQPGHGIYAARASFDGSERCAAVNVGVRPTFETGRGVLVEAYLLDLDGDLYGHTLAIDFLTRLRGERRFDSVDALIEQMHRDVEDARGVWAAHSATVPRR